MKIFCRILIYIIMAGTLSGCGGGSDGSSSSNTDPSYPSYSHPDPPSSNIDPPSNSSSDPAPSICKDDAKNCLASSLPDTIYVTKDETELYVVNNSSNPITINKVAFSDGGTTNTLSGLSIDTEKYPNSHNGDFKLPYKIYGITTIYGYYYKCYINIIVTQNYSNNSSTYILVDYTTKGGKHKTSSIKISIALEKNKQPPPSGNDSQYKKYNDYQEKINDHHHLAMIFNVKNLKTWELKNNLKILTNLMMKLKKMKKTTLQQT